MGDGERDEGSDQPGQTFSSCLEFHWHYHHSPGVDTVGCRIETGVRSKDRDTFGGKLEK